MKLLFSSRTKLLKLAEETTRCRLCGVPKDKKRDDNKVSSVAVIPYSLIGEPSAAKFKAKKVSACTTCNGAGKVKTPPPTYTECPTCKPGAISHGGVGMGPGLYKPNSCPTCFNHGTRLVPVHGGGRDDFEEVPCPTCGGKPKNIPTKECPTCSESDKPGFTQEGESSHDILCPTCKGSRVRATSTPYTPILQVKCPHEDGVDTFTKPSASGATDDLGPFDKNYFEGKRLIPLRLLWKIRGVESKYSYHQNPGTDLKDFNGGTREVGELTPPVPQISSSKEPTYFDLFSRTELLDPERSRTASAMFKNIKTNFNSKFSKTEEPSDDDNSLNINFFGRPEKDEEPESFDIHDFVPSDLTIAPPAVNRRTMNPEESKRVNGGPVTVRRVDESDLSRPFLNNPSKAINRTKSLLGAQKQLSEKRSRMSQMFKGMKSIDDEPDPEIRERRRSLGSLKTFRSWRDNLQAVSENLDYFHQVRGTLRKQLSGVIGKRVNPDVATALAHKAFRKGAVLPAKDGSIVDLSEHRLGIIDPMPYIKNDENWHETHSGLGCDHDPGDGHEPDVGCIVDYFNHPANAKNGVTTGVNSRLVVGKYTTEDGKTVLRTVGSRLKRAAESGVPKRDLRETVPKWTPENFGRVVELPAENATCIPNRIQKDHLVVNHTIDSPTEKSEVTPLPPEETGVLGLAPEPVLNKEKVKFPEEIREGGPVESVYVGNPLYQLTNPFSRHEIERGTWSNNPAVQHIAKQIREDGTRPKKFRPYAPEPTYNSNQLRDRPGLTGPAPNGNNNGININNLDLDTLFAPEPDEKPPRTSKKEVNKLNPVEQDADETYDYNKKIDVQKMQRTQVHMVEPTNPTTPDITPDVPKVNNK